MGTRTNRGFTIIETMLVLAITGLMAVGVIAGSTISINQERYRDSVSSLQALLQSQYDQTTNVTNDRSGTEGCDLSSANVTNIAGQTAGTSTARGQSDCVILGRYITSTDGVNLTASTVLGTQTGTQTEPTDLATLQNDYTLAISPLEPQTSSVSWGNDIVQPGTTKPEPFGLLILRSPQTGFVMSFVVTGAGTFPTAPNASLDSLITAANLGPSSAVNLCVNPQGNPVAGVSSNRLAIQIEANAASQSAVQVPSQGENICK